MDAEAFQARTLRRALYPHCANESAGINPDAAEIREIAEFAEFHAVFVASPRANFARMRERGLTLRAKTIYHNEIA